MLNTHTTDKNDAVLVIDDEELIREAVCDIFELAGIQSYSAADGPEGIDILKQFGSAINVVLLDMKMPAMSGTETYQHLYNIKPEIKVIFSSGYSEDIAATLMQLSESDKPIYFLQKPYEIDALIDLVQEVQSG